MHVSPHDVLPGHRKLEMELCTAGRRDPRGSPACSWPPLPDPGHLNEIPKPRVLIGKPRLLPCSAIHYSHHFKASGTTSLEKKSLGTGSVPSGGKALPPLPDW